MQLPLLLFVLVTQFPFPSTTSITHKCLRDTELFPEHVHVESPQSYETLDGHGGGGAGGGGAGGGGATGGAIDRHGRFKGSQSFSPGFGPMRISVVHLWKQTTVVDKFMCGSAGQVVPSSTSAGATITCQAKDLMTTDKAAQLEYDVSEAVKFLNSVLAVRTITTNLMVKTAPDCEPTGSFYNMIPASDTTAGIANSDFVLYVTVRPTPGNVLAFALACQYDQWGRPIVGHANFGAAAIPATTGGNFDQTTNIIAKHEIIHALGFSSDGFTRFRNPVNSSLVLPVDQVLKSSTVSRNGGTIKVTKMITPKVREIAQRHFQCTTLEGVEIENGGGSGTAGSHWEKRIFDNDFMTGVKSEVPLVSKLTFAALQDTGLYNVNFDALADLTYGAGLGCAFAEGSCGNWATAFPKAGLTCSDPDTRKTYCSADGKSKSQCNVCDYSVTSASCPAGVTVPPEFQYFTNPKLAGRSDVADYCPLIQPLRNGACTDPGNFAIADTQLQYPKVRGETYSAASRCFGPSTIAYGGQDFSSVPLVTCHTFTCKGPGQVAIRIVPDGYTGQPITALCDGSAATATIDPAGVVKGNIQCPSDLLAICPAGTTQLLWPTLKSVVPATGAAGSTLTIMGSDFSNATAVQLTISRVDVNCTTNYALDSNRIVCTLSPSYSGEVQIAVVDPSSKFKSFSAPGAFVITKDTPTPEQTQKLAQQDALANLGTTISSGATNAANTVSKQSQGLWYKLNKNCGGFCYLIPIGIALIAAIILYVLCCRKSDPKNDQPPPQKQQHPPPPLKQQNRV